MAKLRSRSRADAMAHSDVWMVHGSRAAPPCADIQCDTGNLPIPDIPATGPRFSREISRAWRNMGPNPWHDVAHFVPLPDETYQQGHRRFPFTSLPDVVIYHLARLLPKESAIALALTSRALYSILGPRFFIGLSNEERWRLLLLLERDTDLLVACQQCKKLHGPCAPLASEPNSTSFQSYPSSPEIATMTCLRNHEFLLPEGATPAFCRLLAKRYIRRQPYGELLTMASRTRIYTLPDFKLFSTTIHRMVNGQLLLRQETVIAPFTSQGELTGRGAYLLNSTTGTHEAPVVCPHLSWEKLGISLSRDRKSKQRGSWYSPFEEDYRFATAHGEDDEDDSDSGYLFGADHLHDVECYDATPVPRSVFKKALGPNLECVLLHNQPCRSKKCCKLPCRNKQCSKSDNCYQVGLVRACKRCDTDVCITARDIDGIGRVLALTTWKNLGGVYDGQPAAWYTHRRSSESGRVGISTGEHPRERRTGPMVYTVFENVLHQHADKAKEAWYCTGYTPCIGRRIVSHFTSKPNIKDGEWDMYLPSWNRES